MVEGDKVFLWGFAVLIPIVFYFHLFVFGLTSLFWWLLPLSFVVVYSIFNRDYASRIFVFIEHNAEKFLIIILFAIVIIFIRAGIFDIGPITIQDYPNQFFYVWYLDSVLIPEFDNVIGPAMEYQLGYLPFYDHPIGPPLAMAVIHNTLLGTIPL